MSDIHNCEGTEKTRTVIRYSNPEDSWLMITADGGEHQIIHCPYCGIELEN
ncbi:hypothetical protein Q9R46_14685 [Paenibacillus sp. RRE4]|uniref:hypothetical protein n=1 Tax=Paenibacillus sp. RRE4 TaxID=2962587 RepID=UPI002880C085|nr:hypothetical protein [Paenibacillus sp. RRE4]MDT0123905.1 hypothetical protein [Paenibacillus sp. RRE4]